MRDPEDVLSCDICIVGAGLAGLNALFVVSQYLTKAQRIVLIDRRKRVGGMWVDTYSYVRLHQPHGMFTAGDIEWQIRRDRAYLAAKSEVLDHLQYCLEDVRRRVAVDEHFGWTFDAATEGPHHVRISCSAADGRQLTVVASRLIKAFGLDITPNEPLPLRSRQVRSVSPDSCDIHAGEIRDSSAPVWVVGGGKTAMDTAYGLLCDNPRRSVNMVAGGGTYFMNRQLVFPTGWRRWWAGSSIGSMGTQLAQRFDGFNEADVVRWHRANFGLSVNSQADNFKFGLLSPGELSTISAGLGTVIMGHLVDVVDTASGPELVLRDGTRHAVEAESWIVNCTGYLYRDDRPYEPYVSEGGRIVTVNSRSQTHFLTSHMGYYLTHLLMLGRIMTTPLYQIDVGVLERSSKSAAILAMNGVTVYNLGLIADVVPPKVFTNFRADLNDWFPPHRRLMEIAAFAMTYRRRRPHQKAALDAVRDRFDGVCGPLPHISR